MFIVAIDPGIVNVGFFCCEVNDQKAVQLCAKKIQIVTSVRNLTEDDKEDAILDWIKSMQYCFEEADYIIVEKQMRTQFISFVCMLRALYRDKVVKVTSLQASKLVGACAKIEEPVPKIQKLGKKRSGWIESKSRVAKLYSSYFKHHNIASDHNIADAIKLCDWFLKSQLNFSDENLFVNIYK